MVFNGANVQSEQGPPRIAILYGSQTGTSQAFADYLGRQGRKRGFDTAVQAWDEYDLPKLSAERVAIILVSTTGNGVEPDNMRRAWAQLEESQEALGGLHYGVFGCGDSSYTHFNAVAVRMKARLAALGAHELVPICLGDDRNRRGVGGDFMDWCKQSMWPALYAHFADAPGLMDLDGDTLQPAAPQYEAVIDTTRQTPWPQPEIDDVPGFYQRPEDVRNTGPRPFVSRLLKSARMTAEDWDQDTRHYELDVAGFSAPGKVPFRAGDVAYIYPENGKESVDRFLALFDVSELDWGSIRYLGASGDGKSRAPDLPSGCTLGRLFRRYLDIEAPVTPAVLEELAAFATDDDERAELLWLSSPEGYDDFWREVPAAWAANLHAVTTMTGTQYCTRLRLSLADVMSDFLSVRPPLARMLELLPRIRPRAFSVASSPLPGAHPDRLHLLVAVVEYYTARGTRKGLCSGYLSELPVGSAVPLWIRPGTFSLPQDLRIPLIMVGPGTGLAPFRAMIQERLASGRRAGSPQGNDADTAAEVPPDMLFFGCRKAAKDFYYQAELQGLRDSGQLDLHLAFSRDPNSGLPQRRRGRVYVTYRLWQAGAKVWDLLSNHGARFFIAGSASTRMAPQVLNMLVLLMKEHGKLSEEAAVAFLQDLGNTGRCVVECW